MGMDRRGRRGVGTESERSLMERIHGGDASAMDEMLRCYWNPLVAYADRLLGAVDAAEDVAQEAFVRVWEGRGDWDPSDQLQAFLYRIVRNLSLNRLKHERVRSGQAHRVRRRASRSVPTPSDEYAGTELQWALDRALEALPPRRREVFLLSRYHGLSYREIAEAMEVSPQTVANHMSAALDELRERLAPFLPRCDRVPYLKVVGGPPSGS